MMTGVIYGSLMGGGRGISVAKMGDVAGGGRGDVVVFVAAGGGSSGGGRRTPSPDDVLRSKSAAWAHDML